MTFGNRLRNLRIDAGLTQEALAEKLGIKKQTISRYENSDREPNIRTAKAIADALGLTLEELVHGEGNKKEPTVPSELDEKDFKYIDILHQLNEQKQDQLLSYAEFLLSSQPPEED